MPCVFITRIYCRTVMLNIIGFNLVLTLNCLPDLEIRVYLVFLAVSMYHVSTLTGYYEEDINFMVIEF